MISKQEGGTDRGRLLLPGEQGDWAARNLIPLPPRLFMAPLSRRRAPSPGVRGSGAPGGPAWIRRGRRHDQIRTTHFNIGRTSGVSLVYVSRCVIVFSKRTPNKGFRVFGRAHCKK